MWPGGLRRGNEVHVENRDPQNPFGGNLGRAEPLAVAATELDSSADMDTVRGLLDTASGTAPSLMDDPNLPGRRPRHPDLTPR